MTWWLLIIAVAAFILWRRYRAPRPKEISSPAPRRSETPAPPQRSITETVSVVLRRQIPPRDEAPRSWLGGLPMMPDEIPWPRSVSSEHPQRGERPLHFVAQIACADLPAALWGGLGPRQGWLLFFVDPNQGVPEGPDAFRVIHVATLGSERAAPADLGPVHDGVYTGARYDWCRTIDEVPSLWRRWPVDLVTVPNTIRTVGNRRVAAPENLADALYPGQPIATERNTPAEPQPFTWRGALYVLGALERSYSAKLEEFRLPHETVLTAMKQPGMAEALLRAMDERIAQLGQNTNPSAVAAVADLRRQRTEIAAFLALHPTVDSLLDYFRRTSVERQLWHDAARARIAAEREAVLAHALDTPIDAAELQAIKDRLQQERYAAWTYDWVQWQGERHFGLREVVSRVGFDPRGAIGELIADYYVDPARRHLVSADLRAVYEPYWRRLEDNMPHRLGGYHDGVQSDPEPGPVQELLLFQIVSDPAMNWCWGDVGAYYVFIRPDDLERGDFSRVTMTLECH